MDRTTPLSTPQVFDRELVRRRMARARQAGYVDFLLARALDDLGDRLAAVTRDFPHALDIGTPGEGAAPVLAATGRVAAVTRAGTAGAAGMVEADEERLPFAPETFDLAVSLLSLQQVNDLPGVLIQIRRALKPDGLFVGCLLGGQTLTELRQAFAAAEAERDGGISPRVAPFADVRDAGGLLQRAGFALPVADSEAVTVRYASVFGLMADLRGMGLTNALTERRKVPLRRGTLLRMAEIYAERFSDPDGRVRATFEMVWLSGWSPHESQQKPLKPGSAKARLADALGVTEIKGG